MDLLGRTIQYLAEEVQLLNHSFAPKTHVTMRALVTKTLPFFCIAALFSLPVFGQLPPNQPEQDCFEAIPLCQPIFHQTQAYTGEGLASNEINPYSSCLLTGELNSVWYTFTVQSSGSLCFQIRPTNPNDDYDWALFNITDASCRDIFDRSDLLIGCNYYPALSACDGFTGAMNLTSGNCYPSHEPCIPVQAGQTYVLNVSNYTASNDGYILDFSTSSASILDQSAPSLASVDVSCDQALTLHFSEPIDLFSIQDYDFELLDSAGNAYPLMVDTVSNDLLQRYQQQIQVESQTKLESGTFTLSLVDTLVDKCGNIASIPQSHSFHFESNKPTLWLNKLRFCVGDSALVSVHSQDPVTSLEWFDGRTEDRIWVKPEMNTRIYVAGQTMSGCAFRLDTNLVVSTKPTLELSGPKDLCTQQIDTFIATTNAQNPVYHWRHLQGGYVRNRTGQYPIAFQNEGITQIICTAEQRGCYSDTIFYEIPVLPSPDLRANYPTPICPGPELVSFTAQSQTDGTQIAWSIPSLNQYLPQDAISLNFAEGGKYPLSVEAIAPNGCVTTISDTLDVLSLPVFDIQITHPCAGKDMQLAAVFPEPTFPHVTLDWWLAGNSLGSGEEITTQAPIAGTYQLEVVLEDSFGCIDTTKEAVVIQALPTPMGTLTDHCAFNQTTLKVLHPNLQTQYSWTVGDTVLTGSEAPYYIDGLDPIPFTLVAENAWGCQGSFDSLIFIDPPSQLSVEAPPICLGGSGQLIVSQPESGIGYTWYADPTGTTVLHTGTSFQVQNFDSTQQYWVQARPADACPSLLIQAPITIKPALELDIRLADSIFRVYEPYFLAASSTNRPAATWQWTLNGESVSKIPNPRIDLPSEGTHQLLLQVSDSTGCQASASQVIRVRPVPAPYVPNAFSPNGDGINDLYSIQFEAVEQISWQVFDRWGKKVFLSTHQNGNWDGRGPSGEAVPEGVYSLLIKGKYLNGDLLERQASITLIR